jgi:hypothetical protein
MSKIALVHDYFIQMGGAERVAIAMHDSFPSAPIYTTAALQHLLQKRLRQLFRKQFTLYSVAPVGWLLGWISAQQSRETFEV